MKCPVVNLVWVWCDFWLPVFLCSGLCSCVVGELAWYVLLWSLLALGWSLVSVYGGFWMSCCRFMFHGVRSFLVFSCFGFKPPASGFQSLIVASRLLHPYLTCDKSSSFKDNGLPFWVPGVLHQCSEVVLWKLLSVQMIFWWICGGESGLLVLFLCHVSQYKTF